MTGTDNRIALSVSQTGCARRNGRTLGNADSIGDQTASGVLAATLVIAFDTSAVGERPVSVPKKQHQ